MSTPTKVFGKVFFDCVDFYQGIKKQMANIKFNMTTEPAFN